MAVFRADIQTACALSTPPRFINMTIEGSDTDSGIAALDEPTKEATNELLIGPRLLPALLELRRLVVTLEAWCWSLATDYSSLSLPEAYYGLQLRLVSIYQGATHECCSPTRIWCIAASVFLEVFLHGVSPNAATIRRLVLRLKRLIEEGRVLEDNPVLEAKQSAHLHFWIVFVGTFASTTLPWECASNRADTESTFPWYLQELSSLCDSLQLHSWAQAEAVLQTVCWPTRTASTASRALWRKLQSRYTALDEC